MQIQLRNGWWFDLCLGGFIALCAILSVTAESPTTDIATAHSNTVVASNKNEAMQHFQTGKNLMQRKLFQGAIQEFKQALVLDPAWKEAKMALEWAKRDWRLSQELEGQTASSLPELIKKAQVFYERGRRLEAENNLLEAALAYKDALNTVKDYPEAKTALQRVQNKAKGQIGSGEKAYLEPTRPKAADVNAMLDTKTKRRKLPRAIIRHQSPRYVRFQPTGSAPGESKMTQALQTHYLNGCQALDSGDFSVAIQEFELVLEFVPDHKKAAYKLSQAKGRREDEIQVARQKIEEATASKDTVGKLKALRNLLSMDPNNPQTVESWEKAKKENPELAEQLYRKGVELYAQEKYQSALQYWELVLDLNPHHKKSKESIKQVREKLLRISE